MSRLCRRSSVAGMAKMVYWIFGTGDPVSDSSAMDACRRERSKGSLSPFRLDLSDSLERRESVLEAVDDALLRSTIGLEFTSSPVMTSSNAGVEGTMEADSALACAGDARRTRSMADRLLNIFAGRCQKMK